MNAAAYTAVDQAENDEPAARAINTEAPAVLAEEAKKIGAALIQYSTDYVFDGCKNLPYDEHDQPNPINVYGMTKLAGEQGIRNSGVDHLIFRTAWLYSTRGKNFLLTVLRLATQREELRIVHDQIGAPTWSREIASATVKTLEQIYTGTDVAVAWAERSGTYHMTAGGKTNWHEFAEVILEEAAQTRNTATWFRGATHGKELLMRRVIPIATSDYPTPARRPAYSVLSNSKFNRVFGIQLPDWRRQLKQVFSLNNSADDL